MRSARCCVGVRRREHLAGARVHDEVGRSASTGGAPAARGRARSSAGSEQQRRTSSASHLSRILSPMKSDVECTFGFSCSIVATGTPVLRGDHARRCRPPARPEALRRRSPAAGRRRRRDVLAGVGGVTEVVRVAVPPASSAGADQHDGDRRREQERRRSERSGASRRAALPAGGGPDLLLEPRRLGARGLAVVGAASRGTRS